ncbi:MAG: hypothetical protein RLZZ458_2348 [Planctomycetota bacterium]
MANPQRQLLSDQGKLQLSPSRRDMPATRSPRVNGVLKQFWVTGNFPLDSIKANQPDIGISVAHIIIGGSACPGALVAAGQGFCLLFMRSWCSGVTGIVQENDSVHRRGCFIVVPRCPNPLRMLNPA